MPEKSTPFTRVLLGLRASGLSFGRISMAIGVPAGTIWRWSEGKLPKRERLLRLIDTHPEAGMDLVRAYEETLAPWLALECKALRGQLQAALARLDAASPS